MLLSGLHFKQILVDKSGSQWWNAFVLMEPLYHRLLFSRERICRVNGYQQVFMRIGSFHIIQKNRHLIFTELNGYINASSHQYRKKQTAISVFSFMMDMTVMFQAT